MASTTVISPPVYLVGKKIACWRCGTRMSVVSIIAEVLIEGHEADIGMFTDITDLPPEMVKFIQDKVPTFKRVYSKTTNSNYYGNTCPNCRVLSGDFKLHCEPGAPFFPTDEDEAKSLYLKEIPIRDEVSIDAGVGFGPGDLIITHAKRI